MEPPLLAANFGDMLPDGIGLELALLDLAVFGSREMLWP